MPDVTVALQELELLPVKELQSNIYIKHPVSMEQYLMEGSYNKVSRLQGCVCVCVCMYLCVWVQGF